MKPFTILKKHKKKLIALAVVALGITGYLLFGGKGEQKAPLVAHAGEFVNQISVSGNVKASQDVDLSFSAPGIVRGVYAKVGDRVFAGKLLAAQDTGDLYAQSLQMQAGIDLQKAKLAQLLAGSSSEDIKIKQDAVLLAKQDLQNAYESSAAQLTSSYNAIYNASTLVNDMVRTYFTDVDQEGIKVQTAQHGITASLAEAKTTDSITVMLADLNATYDNLKIIREQCDVGLYYSRVLATDKTSLDTVRASINTALTATASSKQSIASYTSALQQAENALQAIQAVPRQTDTAVYEAQIKQAEAQLQQVYAQISQKQIIAPISGTVTLVNAKVGSIASSTNIAVSLISNGKFQIESYVPEIYVAQVKIGNNANITLDAYGPDKKFGATVVSIDPSETIKDGVATYKTNLQFTGDDAGFKDGMSANVVIITSKKQNVISVPQGLVKFVDGKKVVNVLQGDAVIQKEVVTGDISSSGNVEIISGIGEGDVLPLQ